MNRRDEGRPLAVAALVGVSALVAALFTAPMAASADPASPHEITVPDKSEVVKDLKKFDSGSYIVRLKDSPASTYTGGISGYSATKPSTGKQLNSTSSTVEKYTSLLEDKQDTLASKVGVKPLYNYTIAYNGFAAQLTSEEAARLAKSSAVAELIPNEMLKIQAATGEPQTSGEYLNITTPGGLWDTIGGADEAGKGVVVGVLDTGIAPENPSFAGEPLGSTASGNTPWLSGNTVKFVKGDGNTFSSTRVEGQQFNYDDYSTKIVGAKYFVDGFGSENIGTAEANGEYLSPRDGDSHGSHTGSTAVGNAGVEATVSGNDFGEIAGVAPAAKIAAYKVCWSGQAPDPDEQGDDGCTTVDIVAAIDQAVADGVDVLNYSIGGGSAQTVYSPSDEAFLNAAAAGVFVSASAGNSGPGASTLDNAAPWETTVAASTIPSYEATLELGNDAEYVGASISVDLDETAPLLTGDLVLAESHPAAAPVTPAQANLCLANSLNADVAGTIVVCERGNNSRVAKSAEVKRAGGIGMVLVNVAAGDTVTDDHTIPSIHIDAPYREAIRTYAATEGATATFHPGNITGEVTAVPQLAGFSSHGPVEAAGSDVLKPDITGPGVSILAAAANAEGEDPAYEFLSGTSMSAPHIAGLGALYLGEKPLATPAEIKSALSTTATDTVDIDGNKTTDPFGQGAGQVNPTRMLNPGLLYLSGLTDWKRYLVGTGEASFDGVTAIDPSNLNLPSIAIGDLTALQTVTRTVTSTSAGTWNAAISPLNGIKTKVSPTTLKFTAAGQTKSYTVAFKRGNAPLDAWKTGFVTWTKTGTAGQTARIPVAIHPTSVKAPETASGVGTHGSTSVTVTPGFTGSFEVNPEGLAQGVVTPNDVDPTLPYTDVAIVDNDPETPSEGAYLHEVPEGTSFARFDTVPLEDNIATDFDLYLLYSAVESDNLDDYELVADSATPSAGESIELSEPDPGYYVTLVDYFSTPSGGAAYKDIAYILSPTTNVGNLTATPSTVKGTEGKATDVELSWAGLDPNSFFLGFVYYGDAEDVTALSVETGDVLAPESLSKPSITGKVKPGQPVGVNVGTWDVDTDYLDFSYQWVDDGDAIEGATEAEYTIPADLLGSKLSVIVTASFGEGTPDTAVSSAAVVVKGTSTTSFTIKKNPITAAQRGVLNIKVVTDPNTVPSGKVTVVFGKLTKTITLTPANKGVVSLTLGKAKAGTYNVSVSYAGTSTIAGSKAATKKLVVKK